MRRLTVLLTLLGAACGRGAAGPQTPVPQSVNAALEQFLTAVKANDLSRMGALWGTDRGPASQWMKSAELRQRLAVIQKYLDHAGYRLVDETPRPGAGGRRIAFLHPKATHGILLELTE